MCLILRCRIEMKKRERESLGNAIDIFREENKNNKEKKANEGSLSLLCGSIEITVERQPKTHIEIMKWISGGPAHISHSHALIAAVWRRWPEDSKLCNYNHSKRYFVVHEQRIAMLTRVSLPPPSPSHAICPIWFIVHVEIERYEKKNWAKRNE